jgi:hypothetical protein
VELIGDEVYCAATHGDAGEHKVDQDSLLRAHFG